VKEIIIGGYEKLVKMHDIYEPSTAMAAQFSIPYVVSYAFLKGRPGLEAFTDQAIRDRRVLTFAPEGEAGCRCGGGSLFPGE